MIQSVEIRTAHDLKILFFVWSSKDYLTHAVLVSNSLLEDKFWNRSSFPALISIREEVLRLKDSASMSKQ